MATSIKINNSNLRDLLAGQNGPVYRDLVRKTNQVRNLTRQNLTTGDTKALDTGRLRASITTEIVQQPGGGLVGRVGTNVEYAIYVHEGTGIYAGKGYIYPKKGRFLRWPATNNSGIGNRRYRRGATDRYVYARKVRGVRPRPYLRRALREAERTW